MRQAGLSASRLNQAKSLYVPFFRWAKRRGMTLRNPMVDFEIPTSTYRAKRRTPPEIEELTCFSRPRSKSHPTSLHSSSWAWSPVPGQATWLPSPALRCPPRTKSPSPPRAAQREQSSRPQPVGGRTFQIDAATIAMLQRHCEHVDEQARTAGVVLGTDPFLFSLVADCSEPMPPDYFTKRVGVLKGYLGIEDKRLEVVALEEEALGLRRSPPRPRPLSRTGPSPGGGLSFREIGRHSAAVSAERVSPSKPLNVGSSLKHPDIRASTPTGQSSHCQVHLIRTPRCRIQRQHGRTTSRTSLPKSSHATPSRERRRTTSSRTSWASRA